MQCCVLSTDKGIRHALQPSPATDRIMKHALHVSDYPEMLQQNFDAKQNQNDSARKLRL